MDNYIREQILPLSFRLQIYYVQDRLTTGDSCSRYTIHRSYNTDETLRDPIFLEIHLDWDTGLLKTQKKYTSLEK